MTDDEHGIAGAPDFAEMKCQHGQPGGEEFCIFCLRTRGDRYYSALLAISETEPCPCPCCGEHESVEMAKVALGPSSL